MVCVVVAGCGGEVEQGSGTVEMAARLEVIAAETDAFPRRNAHANVARVRSLRAVKPPSDLRQRIGYEATLGEELLRAGESEAAIGQFRQLLDTLARHPEAFPPGYDLALKDFLALSYLRLGEQENCFGNPNADRCLFPLAGEGIHQQKRGSRQAVAVYEKLECKDFARIDFRVDAEGQPWFLEINPLPTFAPDGTFAIIAELAGQSYEAFLADVLKRGLKRLRL